MEKGLTTFLSTKYGGENCFIYNKRIVKSDFSRLTNGGWKMFADLAKE